jgi:pentose-5-phosphate-3-epimerase
VPDAGVLAAFDGLLVMLIAPGTAARADPRLLPKVATAARHVTAGVDGGMTPPMAAASVRHGARYVVAGRALSAAPPTRNRP